MRRLLLVCAGLSTAVCGPGCKGTGLGGGVRDDVVARMATAQAPISACYEQALTRNRKLKGRMVLRFVAEPATGQFGNVTIARSELDDTELTSCVLTSVGVLQLAVPQKTSASIEYPLDFAPIDATP